MTSQDRFERTLPDLLTALAGTDASDVLDEVLSATTDMAQRPGWTHPTWWLPDRSSLPAFVPELRGTRRLLVLVALLLAALLAVAVGTALAPHPRPVPWLVTYQGVFEPAPPIEGGPLDLLAALPDGRALVVAGDHSVKEGESPPRLPLSIWELTTGRVIPNGIMAAARGPSTVVLDDGRVLLVGGDYVLNASKTSGIGPSTAEVYDPTTGSSDLTGPMADSRWIFAAVKLRDGRVLVTGGIRPPGDVITPLATAEIYDPATGTWAATGSMTAARYGHTMTALADGRVLVVGGEWTDPNTGSELPTAEIYDPAVGRFQSVASPQPIPRDPTGRDYPLQAFAPIVALPDGGALIPGLSCQEVHDLVDDASAGYASTPVQRFEPRSLSFRTAGLAPHCVEQAIALPNGQVFVRGWWYRGSGNESAGPTRWSAIFDPATSAFRLTAAAPIGPYGQLLLLPDGRVVAMQAPQTVILH